MSRYFFEVAYKGTTYIGFQAQPNGHSIQSQLEDAFYTFYKETLALTCSSRTDAGVHAHQNFFHADIGLDIEKKHIYNLNAILPQDILLKNVYKVPPEFHSRFDARSRLYKYYVCGQKNPFRIETAWNYPYPLNLNSLKQAAVILFKHNDYTSFSKKNTQVKTFNCSIIFSDWCYEEGLLVYTVQANRFLRGMVRALVATMLLVGRNKLSLTEFEEIIAFKDRCKAKFDAPPTGLFLVNVNFPFDLQQYAVI